MVVAEEKLEEKPGERQGKHDHNRGEDELGAAEKKLGETPEEKPGERQGQHENRGESEFEVVGKKLEEKPARGRASTSTAASTSSKL